MGDKQIRVLLVDDEEELVSHLVKRLVARGVSAAGVLDGDAAVVAATEQTYDVAIVDLKMPGMGGIELLESLKKLQPFLEVIMLTGHGSLGSAFESGRLDAFGFLNKPYEFDKLCGKISEAFDKKQKALRAAYEEELDAIIGSSSTPRDILEATQRLRKKYEQ